MSRKYKTFSICYVKYIPWHFFKEQVKKLYIFYYYYHWCQKVVLFLQAWFMKISATHKVLTFKTIIPNAAKPLQLVSSLFKIYIFVFKQSLLSYVVHSFQPLL